MLAQGRVSFGIEVGLFFVSWQWIARARALALSPSRSLARSLTHTRLLLSPNLSQEEVPELTCRVLKDAISEKTRDASQRRLIARCVSTTVSVSLSLSPHPPHPIPCAW